MKATIVSISSLASLAKSITTYCTKPPLPPRLRSTSITVSFSWGDRSHIRKTHSWHACNIPHCVVADPGCPEFGPVFFNITKSIAWWFSHHRHRSPHTSHAREKLDGRDKPCEEGRAPQDCQFVQENLAASYSKCGWSRRETTRWCWKCFDRKLCKKIEVAVMFPRLIQGLL